MKTKKLFTNKKGAGVYEFVLMLFMSGIMIYAIFFIGGNFDEKIGEKQFQIMRVMGSAELDIFKTDIGAKFAVYESLNNIFSKGGFSENPTCGSETGYSMWSKKDKTVSECFPNYINELKKEVESNLDNYGVDQKNYELYSDKTRISGISIKPLEKEELFGKSLFKYYANPSFTEEIDRAVFTELETMKFFSEAIIEKCNKKETSELQKCVKYQVNIFNTDYKGVLQKDSDKGYLKAVQATGTRIFKFDYFPYNENLFYKSSQNKIKFALSFESDYRINSEYFISTRMSYLESGQIKDEDIPHWDPNEDLREPEKFEFKGKLSEYQNQRTEICFIFNPFLGEITTEKFYYTISGGEAKRFTELKEEFMNKFIEFTDEYSLALIKGEEKAEDRVNYYSQIGKEYCFFIDIPDKIETESEIRIYAEFTTKDENGNEEESMNIVSVKFVNE